MHLGTRLALPGICLVFLLVGCSADNGGSAPSSERPASGRPVILSMDLAMGLTTGNANGTMGTPGDYDDTWALAMMLDPEQFDILGIVVTMGNGQLAPEMVVTRQAMDALHLDAPLVPGAATWLPVAAPLNFDGTDLSPTCVNAGVELMAAQLRQRDDVTVLATGPLTDVACLVLAYPAEAARIKEVVALVGAAPGPLVYAGKTVRDFNYSMDPRALAVVLEESQIPFTTVTFEASSSAAMPTAVVAELAASELPLARYFGEASQAYADWWESKLGPTKPAWDAAVVWQVLHPEDFQCGPARFELALGPPNQVSPDIYDSFILDPAADPRVTACMSFVDQAAIDRMNESVLAAVGGSIAPGTP